MSQNEIERFLQEWSLPYADDRLHLTDIHVAGLENGELRLQGRLLEAEQRQDLIDRLGQAFPNLRVEAGGVQVVRQTPPNLRWVGTNLTSLHLGQSFLAEMSTQALNGSPVEVLWEEDRWGFVRLADGYLSWTYLPYLTDQPAPTATHLVTAPVGLLRESPADEAGLVTRVLGGTAVCMARTRTEWSELQLAGGITGWLPAADLRGLDALPVAREARRSRMVKDGFRLVGVPYLWGGSSAHGIDCSGLAQLLHRWVGITLPRDADLQFAAGQQIEPPFEPGDLLFFGEQGERRRITHVAVSLGGWRIIHSSRSRNGVHVDDVQAVPHLRDSYLCAASYLG